MKKLIPLFAFVVLGCSVDPGKNPTPVEISGTVRRSGQPITDAIFNLQPTRKGTQATLTVKDGEFRGTVTPGRYTYYVSPGSDPAALQTVPDKYREGSMDRQIDVDAGSKLDITLD